MVFHLQQLMLAGCLVLVGSPSSLHWFRQAWLAALPSQYLVSHSDGRLHSSGLLEQTARLQVLPLVEYLLSQYLSVAKDLLLTSSSR